MSNILVVLMCITVLIHAGVLLYATIKKDRFIEEFDASIEKSKEYNRDFQDIVNSYNEARRLELGINLSEFVQEHRIKQAEMQESFDKRKNGLKKGE